jgi:hypothetical protein
MINPVRPLVGLFNSVFLAITAKDRCPPGSPDIGAHIFVDRTPSELEQDIVLKKILVSSLLCDPPEEGIPILPENIDRIRGHFVMGVGIPCLRCGYGINPPDNNPEEEEQPKKADPGQEKNPWQQTGFPDVHITHPPFHQQFSAGLRE